MKKITILSATVSFVLFFIISCQKDKSPVVPVDLGSSSSSIRTTVSGIVLDESNAPLNGVSVTAYGQTATTNQKGVFVLKNISANKNRCVLKFTKTGFFNRAHCIIASANRVNYVRIVLLSNAASQSLPASAGGTVSLPGGSSIQFQPNSFVTTSGSTYSGTVNLAVKHLSPDDANFGFTIPGGDLAGKNLNNEDVALYTYGMLGVELTGSSGESLQLATGTSATLTMSIAASQLSSAPASIPLWYFDETTSLWKEEGSANKVGNNYVGTVGHFSWWNYDYQGPRAYIKGKVVDCFGTPLANINVTVNGWYVTTTDQNGEFYDAFPCNMTFTVQVLASNNNGLFVNSQVINVPALSPNQVYTIPDIVLSCITRVAGAIKTCTGEASDGFVSVSNSSFYSFQYTANGLFNLIAGENEQAVLYAINPSNSDYSQNITTLSSSNVLNVGNLLLCNSINISANSFILNGSVFSNQTFNVNMTSCIAGISDSIGNVSTSIMMSGSAPPNYNISYYYIYINDTVPGPATCNINISMSDATNNYIINGSNIPCNLVEVGTVGNKIKGEFYGAVYTSVNGGSTTAGTITASFDVTRTP
ncbi:MAG TPA: carboxypeptidase-like regulatory domain-containing protein [Bacteroidia bacterium]|nr:carboxypeptidase-like regulatory domain-containing protein [Bacteroidia bacterium]